MRFGLLVGPYFGKRRTRHGRGSTIITTTLALSVGTSGRSRQRNMGFVSTMITIGKIRRWESPRRNCVPLRKPRRALRPYSGPALGSSSSRPQLGSARSTQEQRWNTRSNRKTIIIWRERTVVRGKQSLVDQGANYKGSNIVLFSSRFGSWMDYLFKSR